MPSVWVIVLAAVFGNVFGSSLVLTVFFAMTNRTDRKRYGRALVPNLPRYGLIVCAASLAAMLVTVWLA